MSLVSHTAVGHAAPATTTHAAPGVASACAGG